MFLMKRSVLEFRALIYETVRLNVLGILRLVKRLIPILCFYTGFQSLTQKAPTASKAFQPSFLDSRRTMWSSLLSVRTVIVSGTFLMYLSYINSLMIVIHFLSFQWNIFLRVLSLESLSFLSLFVFPPLLYTLKSFKIFQLQH